MLVDRIAEPPVSLDDLTADALAADPEPVLADDAVPFDEAIGVRRPPGVLPGWYMPASAPGVHLTGWRRRVAWALIATFLAIAISGLCSTYGVLEIA